ncbi:helix-turn-helix domain-containing protein, partial [Nocardia brasiliensis]|uniref:helix-turn-helix domain-containing protein n=1 Tax=Nocardia brasiliensis TaxID=37326 RepID=UPI002453D54E
MTEPGRRERKKAANRQALADAALRLFLERGYDAVGVREIADAADVSVATLYKHFPGGKEAQVFDQDADREAGGGGPRPPRPPPPHQPPPPPPPERAPRGRHRSPPPPQ